MTKHERPFGKRPAQALAERLAARNLSRVASEYRAGLARLRDATQPLTLDFLRQHAIRRAVLTTAGQLEA